MNWENIKKIFRLLKNTDITEFHFEKDGEKIKIKRDRMLKSGEVPSQASDIPVPTDAQQKKHEGQVVSEADNHGLFTLTSPIVGTFYRASSPDGSPFVEVGAEVNKGQVLCIIEAMKLMNEIESEIDGVIMRILVENGQPVEYGEPLFLIDPR